MYVSHFIKKYISLQSKVFYFFEIYFIAMTDKSSSKDANESCGKKDCLYYKPKNLFHRHHFVWAIIISSLIMVVIFFFLTYHYKSNQKDIVDLHEKYCKEIQNFAQKGAVVKDSCYYINDLVLQKIHESQQNVSQLLELQFNKLQSDFTILSLWASVLMIVFLVFSIYSVFKTDELMKQSRDVLQRADEAAGDVGEKMVKIKEHLEQESKKNTEKLECDAEAELKKIKEEVATQIQTFKELIDKKASEFENKYTTYSGELEKANKSVQGLISEVIKAVRTPDSGSKMDEGKK